MPQEWNYDSGHHGVSKACSSGYEPLGMYQTLVKFQPAEAKVASVSICVVVKPVPPADVVSPEVVTSQKLALTVPSPAVFPTSPPTSLEPLTLPVD